MSEQFFEEQAEHSKIKTAITSTYFLQWARVITGYQKGRNEDQRIAYIDLFAGPGRYKDGAKSTPLFILEKAVEIPELGQALSTLFNDGDDANTSSLDKEIRALPGIQSLRFQPQVNTSEVGEEIVKQFESMNLIPSLLFVDPWGYKGLSLRLINSVLKDWACECIFFFNYNRINMGLSNPAVKTHMEALFGVERAAALAVSLGKLSPDERELTVVEELSKSLLEMGGRYVLPFAFRNELGTRTKHHLIFVSKHPKGYKIMKSVMANQSSSAVQGVPSFEYNPATARQPILYGFSRPLDDLEGLLADEFAGRTMTMDEVYEAHNYGRRYVEKNYKDVLAKMEVAGRIRASPPMAERRKNTFAGHVKVTFPKAGTP